jgi:hydrogenase maturation protein HypF
LEGRRIEIRGTVQGVGFRPWIYRVACEEDIAGSVCNHGRGVTVEAFGSGAALDVFLDRIGAELPPGALIDELQWFPIPARSDAGFVIVESRRSVERRACIPPDLATCSECLGEIFDREDRRHGYAFTNCTHCGPRFTIARDVPYDRATTTMAAFEMCPDCRREYDSVDDRRFHAQPNACPTCGPSLRLLSAGGDDLASSDPIGDAAGVLVTGRIVALKGIGGFHLACDATSPAAVRRLRERKHRDQKPFAVMVADLAAADRLAELTAAERALLASVERPIVLARRRPDVQLAAEVVPDNPLVGVLLAYSPLHHLLLARVGRPLVMTSGNLSDEPIVYRDGAAITRLGGIADVLLVHDREIETPCDDSVARVIAGEATVLRRARGHVPRAVASPSSFERPVLACGAHLKNTFCLGVGEAAYLGPHIGDLEGLETVRSYAESVARMERFLGVRPEIIAHDLHPEYESTRYARSRPERIKIAVQHHHAHVASGMAEHGLAGPVLGVAYDGTGHGTDGTAWGGEVLLARYDGFERVATFRPIPLAGGDKAVREVWRIALALLEQAFGAETPLDALPLFARVPAHHIAAVRQMMARGLNAPLARGVGRYFDAVGALVLGRPLSRHEGQIALLLNLLADPNEASFYPFELQDASLPWTVDLAPMTIQLVRELLAGVPAPIVSAKFHNTLAVATEEIARRATRSLGRLPIVLSGGCFQNALLAERIHGRLSPAMPVHLHRRVPPGDGGLSLGQAVIADAVARRS